MSEQAVYSADLSKLLDGSYDRLRYLYLREAAGHYLTFAFLSHKSILSIRRNKEVTYGRTGKRFYYVKIGDCYYRYDKEKHVWEFYSSRELLHEPIPITEPEGLLILEIFFKKLFFSMRFA